MRGDLLPRELTRVQLEVLEGAHGGRAALATVTGRSGSAPQVLGAKLLMLADGEIVGTVGGGAIEARVIAACRDTLRFGQSRRVRADLVRDLGMCCGGSMELFVEYLEAQARLFLIGAGHVAQALAPIAARCGFEVVVLDDREELLAHPAFAAATTEAIDADEIGDEIPALGPHDAVVILTRDHARDERALAALLEREPSYLGMIGSRRKVHTVLRRVLRRYDERGLPRPSLAGVRAPIGLDLGGRTPAEIALSVVAELVAARNGRPARPLSIVDEVLAGLARADAEDPEPDERLGAGAPEAEPEAPA